MARRTATVLVGGLIFSLLHARPLHAQSGYDAYALSNDTLILFDTSNPAAAGTPVPITGLTAGDTIVGIDFRPVNGHLYGLGYNAGAGTATLYHISHRTGVAAVVGPSGAFIDCASAPHLVTGSRFDVDVDPVTDQLKVVNEARQNFRLDMSTGAFVDGLTVCAGVNMEMPSHGDTLYIDAAAFTSNDLNAGTTTLYTLSASGNRLHVQKAGFHMFSELVRLNGVTVDFSDAALDILPGVNSASNDVPVTGTGLAVLTVAGTSSLYTIDLMTGAAALIGPIGDGTAPIHGMAVHANSIAGGPPMTALGLSNTLARFAPGASQAAVMQSVSGITAGEILLAIDYRPQTGTLYALGVNTAAGTGSASLYRIVDKIPTAQLIGTPGAIADGAGSPVDLAGATKFGFDFDPTTDRIRVVTDVGVQFTINPDSASVTPGTPLNNLPIGAAGVADAAFTNSYGQVLHTGATTMYTLDAVSDRLLIQHTPDSGTQSAGVPLLMGPATDLAIGAFDIAPGVRVSASGDAAVGRGYVAARLHASSSFAIWSISLTTGNASMVGLVGPLGFDVTGLAVGDAPRDRTSLTLTPSANPSNANQAVTFTATVVSPLGFGLPVPTGTVTFTNGGVPIAGCVAMPLSNKMATCPEPFAASGTFAIAASYSGDFSYAGSRVSIQQTVGTAATVTALAVAPNPAQAGESVTLTATVTTVTPGAATGTVTFFVDGVAAGTAPLALASGVAVAAVTVETSGLAAGAHQVTATYGGDATFAASSTLVPAELILMPPPVFRQYFAEGATGFFQTDIGIVNASATDAAQVTVKLLPEGAPALDLSFTLDPLKRRTLDLNRILGSVPGVSAVVESNQPIAATRQMTWGRPVIGSTLESGIAEAAASWYFAEGATGVFSLFYLVENPNGAPVTVTLTHLLEGGGAPIVQTEVVPAHARRTIAVNTVSGLEQAALSTAIGATLPIVVERAMYLSAGGTTLAAGTAGRGATALATAWSFAEGATGFFHTYLLFGNPGSGTATVTVLYQLPEGATIEKSYDVAGQSRRTIDVKTEDARLAATAVGMTISSTLPIVAERAMWWGEPSWYEGSVALGSTQTGTVWAIGEGSEGVEGTESAEGAGGAKNASTFVLVSNGSGNAGMVRFVVVYDDGTARQKEFELAAHARLTVRIADHFSESNGRRFSVLVESLTAGVPIAVEMARYQSAGAFGEGGGAASATRIR